MRRVGVALACCVGVLITVVPAPARGAYEFVDAFKLDPAPSWQNELQLQQKGSWVKHSSPAITNLGPHGTVILFGTQGGKLYALRYGDGVIGKVWDTGPAIDTYIDSSPAVADLNADGCPEVLVGAGNEFRPFHSGLHVFDCNGQSHRFWPAPGHPKPNHVGVFSTPAVGDVNGDKSLDVAYGSFNQKMYVKDRFGRDLPGWPRENHDTIWSSPAMLDLNEDGRREIVIGTDLGGGAAVLGCAKGIRGTLSVFTGRGSFYPRFPKCLSTPIWSTPAIHDLNGDRVHDTVVGTNNYLEFDKQVGIENVVRAWDTQTGGMLWQTLLPAGARVFSSPAVGDVGYEGALDVAIGTIQAPNYGHRYLLDARTGVIRWSREGGHHAICACQFMGSPVLADVSGDAKPDVVAVSEDGGLMAWSRTGRVLIDDLHAPLGPRKPPATGDSYMFFNSPAVGDLDGDGLNEIVLAGAIKGSNPLRGKVWVISTPGRGAGPWPMFKRTPDRTSAVLKSRL